jgi:hypothetical protein
VSAGVKLALYFVEVPDDVFGGKEGLMLAYRFPFSVVNGSVCRVQKQRDKLTSVIAAYGPTPTAGVETPLIFGCSQMMNEL